MSWIPSIYICTLKIVRLVYHADNKNNINININNKAPYIRQQQKGQTESSVPVVEESEPKLPPLKYGAAIRIPPELMPDDDDAMHYFDIYFRHIHPYVPVVHRAQLYQLWQYDRSAISPLLLEAIFACAGRLSDDPAQGAQWLALANSKSRLPYLCGTSFRGQFHQTT